MSSSVTRSDSHPSPQRLVIRNTLYVVTAQIIVTPLTVLMNAVMARQLGPAQFGQLYLATTLASLAFLFVEWGQGGALSGSIARDRSRAGLLLGSSLAWRGMASLLAGLLLIGGCVALGYDYTFLSVLALTLLVSLLGTFSFACHDVYRGFERTDFGAITYVGWQLLNAAVVIPLLLLGGGLHALLWAQMACAAVGGAVMWRSLKPMGVPGLQVEFTALRELLRTGTPFLIFGLVLALQNNLDALLLSKLASADSMGWYAATRKLVGLLIYPATALIAALYPTLCRLHVQDQTAFRHTAAGALHLTALAAAPIALCCGLFPDIGVRIFGMQNFDPAIDNLRVLAAYVFMVYFSMPLSSVLNAAGRQRAWAAVQLGCVALSVGLNLLLIPWCQSHYGNGSLGVSLSTVISECIMLSTGLWLLPRHVLDRVLLKRLSSAVTGGVLMAAVAWALRDLSSFIVAPLALLAYLAGIWLTGGIDAALWQEGRALLKGKSTLPATVNEP